MQLVLHTLVLHIADGPSEASGVSMVPARTTFEKLWQSGHVKVPAWTVGHKKRCGSVSDVHQGPVSVLPCVNAVLDPHQTSCPCSSACMGRPCTLEIFHLRLQAVSEDHF